MDTTPFEKFDDKKCTLTKLTLNGESQIPEGDVVMGIFSAFSDHLGLRASMVQSNGKLRVTSDIQEIMDETDKCIIFKTTTSIYKLEDNE